MGAMTFDHRTGIAAAPLTPAGTIVQTNAEILSGLVVLRLAAPGSPFVYVVNPSIRRSWACTAARAGPAAPRPCSSAAFSPSRAGSTASPCSPAASRATPKEICMQSGRGGGSMAMRSMIARPEFVVGIGMLDSVGFPPAALRDVQATRARMAMTTPPMVTEAAAISRRSTRSFRKTTLPRMAKTGEVALSSRVSTAPIASMIR